MKGSEEAAAVFERHIGALKRLGLAGLKASYVDDRGERFPVMTQQTGASGRIYQFETSVAIEGESLHVFVSMFADRRVDLAREADFIVDR